MSRLDPWGLGGNDLGRGNGGEVPESTGTEQVSHYGRESLRLRQE